MRLLTILHFICKYIYHLHMKFINTEYDILVWITISHTLHFERNHFNNYYNISTTCIFYIIKVCRYIFDCTWQTTYYRLKNLKVKHQLKLLKMVNRKNMLLILAIFLQLTGKLQNHLVVSYVRLYTTWCHHGTVTPQ